MTRNLLTAVWSVILVNAFLAEPPLGAQNRIPVRYPVSEMLVAEWLGKSGIEVAASSVQLPTAISSATASPDLEIAAIERVAARRLRVELRCKRPGDCLPFFAILDLNADISDEAVFAAQNQGTQPHSQVAAHELQPPLIGITSVERQQLRAGSQVSLLLTDGHMLIHLPVRAIDGGTAGTDVRVCTLDHGRIFHATVIDSRTVRGSIE